MLSIIVVASEAGGIFSCNHTTIAFTFRCNSTLIHFICYASFRVRLIASNSVMHGLWMSAQNWAWANRICPWSSLHIQPNPEPFPCSCVSEATLSRMTPDSAACLGSYTGIELLLGFFLDLSFCCTFLYFLHSFHAFWTATSASTLYSWNGILTFQICQIKYTVNSMPFRTCWSCLSLLRAIH